MSSSGGNYIFVIDTNEYAGNFEREMTAYLTGRIGECEVGREMAEIFRKDLKDEDEELFENVTSVPDDNGCHRPATIWPNPRYANDGMGGHYTKENANQKELCERYAKSVEDYETPHIKQKEGIIEDLQAGKTVSNWTVEGAEREIARAKKEIQEAKNLKKVSCYPAYMSVGIWFYSEPTKEQITLMKERAANFAKVKRELGRSWDSNIFDKNFKLTIEGFRLIKFETNEIEIAI
jgi:hypothetical protein